MAVGVNYCIIICLPTTSSEPPLAPSLVCRIRLYLVVAPPFWGCKKAQRCQRDVMLSATERIMVRERHSAFNPHTAAPTDVTTVASVLRTNLRPSTKARRDTSQPPRYVPVMRCGPTLSPHKGSMQAQRLLLALCLTSSLSTWS